MLDEHVSICAIVVAGGSGTRAGGSQVAQGGPGTLPKQYRILAGKPIIQWSLEALADSLWVQHIVVVCAPEFRSMIAGLTPNIALHFADAGATRTASVRAGLTAARVWTPDIVLIHDAARPGIGAPIIARLRDALTSGADGAAPILPVADALWSIEDLVLTQSKDRSRLTRVQTPQAFWYDKIDKAYAGLLPQAELADDVAVARTAHLQVVGVLGDERLDKITWPEDFRRMEALLAPVRLPRVGTGFDAHRFGAGDHVTLCGVTIPHAQGLAGHSDADVGWHALADAIYGALSAGDIGHHFPPSDPRWKGAPSSTFLAHAGRLVGACGGLIHHVDMTLICEAPRIGPQRLAMIEATAKVLALRSDQISIKATTTEGMGFTGRREGIAAQACATILLPDDFRTITEVPLI